MPKFPVTTKTLLFLFVFWLFSVSCYSQVRPVIYGGVDYYRDSGFKADAHANINLGVQVFEWRFLAPEIGVQYSFGNTDNQDILNPQNPQARSPVRLEKRFSGTQFSIAPKLKFGTREASLIILPQYNIGKITARGDYLADTGYNYLLNNQIKISQPVSFWSFAAGVEGEMFDTELFYFSLVLKYTLLNSEEIVEKLDAPAPGYRAAGGSTDGWGVSFRVYFDLLQLFKD